MERRNYPFSEGCLEQSCANHLTFRFTQSSLKLKKKIPNQRDSFVIVIFGEPKNWKKKHVGLNIT